MLSAARSSHCSSAHLIRLAWLNVKSTIREATPQLCAAGVRFRRRVFLTHRRYVTRVFLFHVDGQFSSLVFIIKNDFSTFRNEATWGDTMSYCCTSGAFRSWVNSCLWLGICKKIKDLWLFWVVYFFIYKNDIYLGFTIGHKQLSIGCCITRGNNYGH